MEGEVLMTWKQKPNNPDIRRNTFPVTVQRSGGNVVTENMIIDQNVKTGNYIVYKKNLVGQEVIVIQSNKDQADGLYKITSGPGAQLSPVGIEPKDYEKFIITSLPDVADEQRKNYFQNNGPQAAADLGIPGFRSAANPNPPIGGPNTPYVPSSQSGGSGGTPPPEDTTITNLPTQINPDIQNKVFKDLVYPTHIRNNRQDFIKFTAIKYLPRTLNITSGAIGILEERDPKKIERLGSIILPIQPAITDNNSVDWNGLGINPLEMELASGSLNIMSGNGSKYVNDLITRLGSTIDSNTTNAIKLYFAEKAAGVSGLLSRVSGAIVNPNLELLFQGPTLRPFNFTFRLSPRDIEEATEVRKIIRVFKQYSAVGTASNNLFLTTPNVFNIQYVSKKNGNEEDHKSLNKIKTCALKTVTVDYTPDNSYMTFSDVANTMTSYSLSLQFQELEPITTNDYKDPEDYIGY